MLIALIVLSVLSIVALALLASTLDVAQRALPSLGYVLKDRGYRVFRLSFDQISSDRRELAHELRQAAKEIRATLAGAPTPSRLLGVDGERKQRYVLRHFTLIKRLLDRADAFGAIARDDLSAHSDLLIRVEDVPQLLEAVAHRLTVLPYVVPISRSLRGEVASSLRWLPLVREKT